MAETNAPTTPEPKADRPVGTMSRLSNAKVLLVGIMVVSLATAGFAFAPSLLATNPSDSPSALESDSFQPTPQILLSEVPGNRHVWMLSWQEA